MSFLKKKPCVGQKVTSDTKPTGMTRADVTGDSGNLAILGQPEWGKTTTDPVNRGRDDPVAGPPEAPTALAVPAPRDAGNNKNNTFVKEFINREIINPFAG